ncbi:VOC family protein [Streptomyces sp. JH34]|uniref:VOC family protein n=1 Tax=unclassified Streptomyces TaxID=2593676 RepID=UPI0023F95F16|nr:VOC family protein [Streptomyces sp. JH34]MDF6018259.1 VOC family protein [Streptomyces sp. JH34]
MLRLGIPVIGATDVPRAVAFWTAALNLVATEERESETWRTLEHADGSGRALGLIHSTSAAEPRPRVHLDLFAQTRDEQRSEITRLLGLGARTVDWDLYPPDPDFVVLADPDGNIFCVVDLSHVPSEG